MPEQFRANVETALTELRSTAREASSGRAAHMVCGGPGSHLSQTVIAMRAAATLSEHENPGEATVLVLEGEVRLTAGDDSWDGRTGDLLEIPYRRHALEALRDSAVLLTAVKRA